MYGIFTYIYHKCQPNEVNIPYMDAMGKEKPLTFRILGFNWVKTLGAPANSMDHQNEPLEYIF